MPTQQIVPDELIYGAPQSLRQLIQAIALLLVLGWLLSALTIRR
jgi:hypothetical protein